MKNKKIVAVLAVMTVILLSIASVSYALEFRSNAEIVAGLTGKSADSVNDARQAGESYGEQAARAGKLEAFKDAKQDQLEGRLNELVQEKKLTREQADARIKLMEDRMADCDGTGENQGQGSTGGLGIGLGGNGGNGLRDGSGSGAGFGGGSGAGSGGGVGGGVGAGRGMKARRAA